MQQKVQTNVPLIQTASSLASQAKFRSDKLIYQTGSNVLVPINLGQHVLYKKNPDSNPNKRPEWSEGIVTELRQSQKV